MSTEPQPIHSPSQNPQRPKGILKNSHSYQLNSPNLQSGSPTNPSPTGPNFLEQDPISLTSDPRRPSLPHQQSEKDLVLQNTLANAGPRRNSSNARSSVSRRQSRANNEMDIDDENSPRLKWDEANLFLNEQERPETMMKIDEPKTPFVKQSDLPEDADDEEVPAIDPTGMHVDELDRAKDQPGDHRGRKSTKVGAATGGDIPDLDIGEAEEEAPAMIRTESSEKRVVVDPTATSEDGDKVNEEARTASEEARRKHREFEERRKRHYEVPPGTLVHADEDEDDDGVPTQPRAVPPMPRLPKQ